MKGCDIALAMTGLRQEKEFVQLRRWNARAGKHGMGLAAMMDLMHEKMRQDRADGLDVDAAFSAAEPDFPLEVIFAQPLAEADKGVIGADLGLLQQ